MNEITTVEELDALPVGSILRDSRGEPVWRSERWGWRAGNGVRDVEPKLVIEDGAPLTLLHPLPDAPSPSVGDREALARVMAGAVDGCTSWGGHSQTYRDEWLQGADATLAWFAARQPAPSFTPAQRHAAEQDEALFRVATRAQFGTGEVIDIVLRALGIEVQDRG